MEVKAHLNRLRISPRKVRLVASLVRKMNIDEARKQLAFLNKRSTNPILKLINSAVANAKNNFDLNENNLYISEIFINEGQTMKRWRPRAMGRAARINKRISCVTVVLDEMTGKISGTKNEVSKTRDGIKEAKNEVRKVLAEKKEVLENENKKVIDTEMVNNIEENEIEKTEVKKEVKNDIEKTEDKK